MNRKYISLLVCVALALLLWFPVEARAESALITSQSAVDFIKGYEGFSEKPYWDYAQWTVGYGTRCPEDKLSYYQTYGITREEAEELLKSALGAFEKSINTFADNNSLTLSQQQFDALISFSFNCGSAWTLSPEGTLYKAVVSGDTGNPLIYAFTIWSKAGGSYLKGLTYRRLSEANMYINGQYGVNTYPANYRFVYLDPNGGTIPYGIFGFDANVPQALELPFSFTPSDASGNKLNFGGWYTASGVKIETLDSSVTSEQTLKAKWLDAQGNEVQPVLGTVENDLQVTVTGTGVNIRSGPGTSYSTVGTANKGDVLTVTEVYSDGSYTWGKTEKGWIALEFTNYHSVKGNWALEDGKWVYYQGGVKLKNAWISHPNGLCYVGEDGYMVTNGWAQDTNGWRWLGEDGYAVKNSWVKDSVGWCYMNADAYMMADQWLASGGKWYYLSAGGYMLENQWAFTGGKWYYMDGNGHMVANQWVLSGKKWYYMGASGAMAENQWVYSGGKWYYMNGNGHMVTDDWVYDGVWYYMDKNGHMVVNDWVWDRPNWYYMDKNGHMFTGDRYINGRKYTFLPSGAWNGK